MQGKLVLQTLPKSCKKYHGSQIGWGQVIAFGFKRANEIYCNMLKYLPGFPTILMLLLSAVIIPDRGFSSNGSDSEATQEEPVEPNSRIVAAETARLILARVNDEGELFAGDDSVIPQPVYLEMDVPVSARDHMYNKLLSEGIRLTDTPDGCHVLRIEWEPENTVIIERGGTSRRILSSDIYFSWMNPDREIQNNWNTSFYVEHEIPSDQVSELTDSWNPARFHNREESRRYSILSRMAEPAIITGAVAVTIYLLYNVRS